MTPEPPAEAAVQAALRALRAPALAPDVQRAVGDRLEAAARARLTRRRRLRHVAVLAGAAALAVTLAIFLRPSPPAPSQATRLRTGPGDFQLLPLGDRGVAFV
jgi:hypothetical protein